MRGFNKEEVKAVLAHEIGHLRHNDAVVMTIVSAIPIIAYMVGRTLFNFRFLRAGSGGNRKGSAGGILAAMILTAIAAWIVYFITQLLVMWLSRSREYYADAYSAYATRNPGALESALSKIAYGLSVAQGETNGLRAFYIGDQSTAKREVAEILDHQNEFDLDRNGVLDEKELEAAMSKEAKSSWGKINELFSTHPSTYKRIILLKGIEREVNTSSFREEDAYKLV
ncbi:Protease HtpX [uncultured archaeon]|nr:Protease HtpX [uncultured archaeon]